MPSGSKVLSGLTNQIEKLESERSRLNTKINRHENDIQKFSYERDSAYLSLARFYLPSLEAEKIEVTLKEKREKVEAIFNEKQKRRKFIEDNLERSEKLEKKYNSKLTHVNENLEEIIKERAYKEKLFNVSLKGNEEYQRIVTQLDQEKERIIHNEERAQELVREREEKLKPYMDNKIFIYLKNRNFGTNQYRSWALTRKLDEWVAKKISYKKQKENFDFLVSMPDLVNIELDKRKQNYNFLDRQRQSIELETSDNTGLTEIVDNGKEIANEKKALIGLIEQENTNQNDYSNELIKLAGHKGKYHEKALEDLKAYLKGKTISDLMKQAKETPSPVDDRLVGIIEKSNAEIKDIKFVANNVYLQRKRLMSSIRELKDIKRRFTSHDFESSYSEFDSSFDIRSFIGLYLAGKMTKSGLWTKIEINQDFDYPSSPSSYSTSSSSSSSYSSSSWGSGGGFSTGGGFGGGGFSTGGGF